MGTLLAARDLGEVMEVGVGGAEDEIMLDGKRGDPEVVGGDLCAFLAELEVEVRAVMRGLFVRE